MASQREGRSRKSAAASTRGHVVARAGEGHAPRHAEARAAPRAPPRPPAPRRAAGAPREPLRASASRARSCPLAEYTARPPPPREPGVQPELREVERHRALDPRRIDPVRHGRARVRGPRPPSSRHGLRLALRDRDQAVGRPREGPLDGAEDRALGRPNMRAEEEREGVGRVHAGADPRGERGAPPEDPAFELWVWTTSGRSSFSAALSRRRCARSRPAGWPAPSGRAAPWHPRPRAHRGRRRSPGSRRVDTSERDAIAPPALAAGHVDEVAAGAADRRLHDVRERAPAGLRSNLEGARALGDGETGQRDDDEVQEERPVLDVVEVVVQVRVDRVLAGVGDLPEPGDPGLRRAVARDRGHRRSRR